MNPDYVNRVSAKLKINRADLLEKDLILHQILTDLSNDGFFPKNFVFKGGTCLIKHYLGYLRFSEDIDFTWKDQTRFESKTSKTVSRELSGIIDDTGKVFEDIAKRRSLDFECKKNDIHYVELGGSNKTCTFKIWYQSDILKKDAFIKVQINLVEELCSESKVGRLTSILTAKDKELEALFPEHAEYSKTIQFPIYVLTEILSEKIRALLTRQGIKARDFLDIYLIQKKKGIKPSEVEVCVIKKTNHALKLYEKYRTNLQVKIKLLEKDQLFEWGEEKDLLLSKIDEKDFYNFITEFTEYLKELVKKFDAS